MKFLFFSLFSLLVLEIYTEKIYNASSNPDEFHEIVTEKPTRFMDKVRNIGRKQSIGVRGKLMCGGVPVRNATVKLWDNDFCKWYERRRRAPSDPKHVLGSDGAL